MILWRPLLLTTSNYIARSSSSSLRMSPDPDAVAFHSYASAAVDLSQVHVGDSGVLTLVRSVRDIDANKKRKFLYTLLLGGEKDSLLLSQPPQELSPSVLLRLPSPSEAQTALFQQLDASTLLLEIYQGSNLVHRIPLPQHQQHGKVITGDPMLGGPSWNQEETMLVYGAERLPPSTTSFFARFHENDTDETVGGRGAQCTMGAGPQQEPWGEGYADGVAASLVDLFTVQLATGAVERVSNVPQDQLLGQAIFVEESLVYTGWDAHPPRRLGLTYCQQRPSQLYRSSLSGSDSNPTLLTPDAKLSHSPRALSNGKIVYLTNNKGFETHQGCMALAMIDTAGNSRIVVDVVHDPVTAQRSTHSVLGLPFPGLYDSLPTYTVVNDETVVLTTQWGSCKKVARISLVDGSVSHAPFGTDATSSDQVLFADGKRGVVCVSSCPHKPASDLYHIPAEQLLSQHKDIQPRCVASFESMAVSSLAPLQSTDSPTFTYEMISTRVPKVQGSEIENPIQSILLLPPETTVPPPLIVVPHGGPHSVASTIFMPGYAYLCGHGGYAVLLVNYRGSTGFGQGSIELLPGEIGSLDVADVLAAMDAAQDRIGSRRLAGICGGSHGGFLAAHLSARYPERFQAAVLRNPVVNIPSMVTATDIPDWCYVEGCDGTYHWDKYRPPTAKDLQSMYEKSPIRHVDQVKVPTLVALGMKDLRVPPSQGLEWFYSVKSLGVPTQLQVYEDDVHAIDHPASEADHFVHIKKWFDQHLQVPEIPAQ